MLFSGAGTLDHRVRLVHLMLGSLSQVFNAISSVKSRADLLVSLNKPFKLNVQVFVLVLENVAVVHECIDL